ncbi:PHP domain-containing protein [Rubidibacter lacunae]|nr:PHP domain-containing protein [Rubidibacter lacunae]
MSATSTIQSRFLSTGSLGDPLAADALRRAWATVDADSCPRQYNFHLHTVCSDGKLEPEVLIEQAIELGLAGLAITDHHRVSGFGRAWQRLQQIARACPQRSLPHLWSGVEINGWLDGTEVHLLGYAFDPDCRLLSRYLQGSAVPVVQAVEVINALHEAGGMVVLAHPARYGRSVTELIPAAARLGVDGVETYYAYKNPIPWQPSPMQTRVVRELSATYGLFDTCGTDTHGPSLLSRL